MATDTADRTTPTTRQIREWATAAGHDVPSHGRIPATVRLAWEAEHLPPPTAQDVRVWARGAGIEVSRTGSLPARVVAAWDQAHPGREFAPTPKVTV